VVRTGSM